MSGYVLHRSTPLDSRGLRTALVGLYLLGCSSGPRAGQTEGYGFLGDSEIVWVRGPWDDIRPSGNVDEVIDQLCPAVMALPRAQQGEYGQEYCGVIYSFEDGLYYASMPSPLTRVALVGPSRRKSCFSPSVVKDSRGQLEPLADFHSHPWSSSPLSEPDRRGRNQRYRVRIQFDTTCRIQKLVPYVREARPGEVYERQSGSWKLIGYIQPEDKDSGFITSVQP
ncbi:hypothetical protein CYFUS_005351 [Cystobacter fuscus]|uniref:JAB domain-containing protein n=1 Tax=Cystobacter fuscus TaxID=43 RepID=A0A250J8I6_9BACT|nr:hypothetical protein [Cystobacter fuscus]ATB39903.1 hypothetical protein CYFUS_005351 [Cystobacter fuscus]